MQQLEQRSALPRAASGPATLTVAAVVRTWWPLAASWLLMGVELPALNAAMAHMADPEINLAAFGAIVFPVALFIEAPIIMFLAASTALCRDADSFHKLARFVTRCGAGLTLVHAACAFTPLYELVVLPIIDPPAQIVEPGRLGLQLTTFWTWCIADRRFRQGVLIRFGKGRSVGIGTIVRLASTVGAVGVGALLGLSGLAAASTAWAVGVFVEMLFVRWAVGPVLREHVMTAPPHGEVLTTARLLEFYVPLALTPCLVLAVGLIGAAAISRMPASLPSLAAWSVVHSSIFMLRSVGMAFNEVAVRHAGEPGAARALSRFAVGLALAVMAILALVALTPLARAWFAGVYELSPEIADLAARWLWIGIALPGFTVAHSLYQGYLVSAGRTRGVTEAVLAYLAVCTLVLAAGVVSEAMPGVAVALFAVTAGAGVQALWLRIRVRALLATVRG